MPLIAFCGDCHYQIYKMYDLLIAWEKRTGNVLDAVVHVGDYGVDMFGPNWKHLWDVDKEVPIETWVCMGNHEDYPSIQKWQAEPERITRLHLLPDGGVTDVLGVKIASLWGNFSPKSWMNPDRIKHARDYKVPGTRLALHIYRPSVFQLMKYTGKVDVLITHDASSIIVPMGFYGNPIPEGIRPILGLDKDENKTQGCPGITDLLRKFEPTYHFYGHYHVKDVRQVEGTKVICLNAFDKNASEAVEVVQFGS
jgi:predicted phosphodiesterase